MLELTSTQREIYFEGRFFGDPVNNIGGYQRYPRGLNVQRFLQARERVLRSNDAYSLRFIEIDGRCVAVSVPDAHPEMDTQDLSADPSARDSALAWVQAQFEMPFKDLGTQVFHDVLIRISADEYWYYAKAHHLMMDGWGFALQMQRILDEYKRLTDGDITVESDLPEYPSFAEHMRRQAEYPGSVRYAEDRVYWLKRLANPRQALFAPAASSHSERVTGTLGLDLFTALRELATGLGVAPTTLYYAVLYLYFSRTYQSNDVLICSPVHNRRNATEKAIVGSFVNVNAHCLTRPEGNTFVDLVKHIAQLQGKDYRHSRMPLGHLVRELRQAARNESFLQELSFNYQKLGFELSVDNCSVDTHFLSHHRERNALSFVLCEYGLGQDVVLHLDYNNSSFDRDSAQAILQRILGLLRQVAKCPTSQLEAYTLMTPREWQLQFGPWKGAETELRDDVCMHEFFEQQVLSYPERVAVSFGTEKLTYRQLNEYANQLAHYLIACGAGPDRFVGICHGRSMYLPVAMLAVLKAGAAYVPIDPAYPPERTQYIFDDAELSVVLTDDHGRAMLPQEGHALILDVRDFLQSVQCRVHSVSNPERQHTGLTAQHLAYVIYTSGSTGRPKGVLIEHRNGSAFIQWALQAFESEDLQAVLASTSICFDLSIFEFFVPLACGGQVVMVENILALKDGTVDGLTLINTVPSAIKALLDAHAIPNSVRCINLAGEPLRQELVEALHASVDIKLYDLYGPSESTTYSTMATRRPSGRETIGRPIANTQIYVFDAAGHPLPPGAVGELHIGGAGLARGYLNQAALTADKFVFNQHAQSRLYRTGDLVRFDRDGSLQYLGRIDNQVKIRGYRIETGEIEACLLRHPAIRDCAVDCRDDVLGDGGKTLVAYVVATEQGESFHASLAPFVAQSLPNYMVPAIFVALPALPLTPTGKLDRKGLPAPSGDGRQQETYVAPRNTVEHWLCVRWAALLGLERVGVRDNFFALGGDSLLLVKLAAVIDADFSVRLDLATLFANPTIDTQGQLLTVHWELSELSKRVSAEGSACQGSYIDL